MGEASLCGFTFLDILDRRNAGCKDKKVDWPVYCAVKISVGNDNIENVC